MMKLAKAVASYAKCGKCRRVRPIKDLCLVQFRKNNEVGSAYRCIETRDCCRIYNKEWRVRNNDYYLEYNRKYRKKNYGTTRGDDEYIQMRNALRAIGNLIQQGFIKPFGFEDHSKLEGQKGIKK